MTPSVVSSRETVLDRIREALRVRAPRHPHHHGLALLDHQAHSETFRQWLPRVGSTMADRLKAFSGQSQILKTRFHDLTSFEAAATLLQNICAAEGWQRIATHAHPLAEKLARRLPATCLVLAENSAFNGQELEACDAGVTGCECLVAQTGSVCVTSRSSGGRSLSVAPPHHVVIANREQLVMDLTAAYDHLNKKYANDWPSFIGLITGPSRTGDIERILVLGAHGPKKLTVITLP
jgi:L-lactate dehydrogenase complex protein LldG